MQYVSTQLRHSLNIESVVSIHYFEYTADFRYPGEEHDFWELIYCDKGELRISAGNHDLLLRHGQAFLHPPKQFHNVRAENQESANSVILSFYSDTPELSGIADKIICTDDYTANALFSVLREAQASFSNSLGKIYDAQLMRKSTPDFFATEQVIQNYIELLLIHLIRADRARFEKFPELPEGEKKNLLIEQITEYMKENLDSKLTFRDLSARFLVSSTTLKNLFRKHCNLGAMEYLTALRIERSKELLRGGTMSCTAIALSCGFCSVHHFSKVFKDEVGMSPTEYVKSIKSLLEDASAGSVPTPSENF